MRFTDVFGQEAAKRNLKLAIKKKKMSHAYILNGEPGLGKHKLAEAFAAALLCERGGEEACGECRNCRRISQKNHPDVKWISHEEKKSTVSVDQIRSEITSDVMMRPYESEYKLYMISNAEKLGREAQNAILKTIEEPPEYAIIFLLSDNINGLLPTVRSRCVTINLLPETNGAIRQRLLDHHPEVSPERIDMATAYALGNIGKAEGLIADEDFIAMANEALELVKGIPDYSDARILSAARHIGTDYKDRLSEFLDLLEVWYRDVLLYKATEEAGYLMLGKKGYEVRQQAKNGEYVGLGDILDAIALARMRQNANVSAQTVAEQLLFTIKESI